MNAPQKMQNIVNNVYVEHNGTKIVAIPATNKPILFKSNGDKYGIFVIHPDVNRMTK